MASILQMEYRFQRKSVRFQVSGSGGIVESMMKERSGEVIYPVENGSRLA